MKVSSASRNSKCMSSVAVFFLQKKCAWYSIGVFNGFDSFSRIYRLHVVGCKNLNSPTKCDFLDGCYSQQAIVVADLIFKP